MKKTIYKNQLVSYIHALSGKPYKEARQICKAAKWNEETAIAKVLNYDKCIDMFVSTSKALVRSFNEMGEAVQKMTNNLGPALQTIADPMRQVRENMIQNDT